MNIRLDHDQPALRLEPKWRLDRPSRLQLLRSSIRSLGLRRLVFGGRIDDAGRLPRYALLAVLGVAALWGPVVAYLGLAPVRFTSSVSLILPGSGAANSINLSDIGQASSFASSAYASSSLSPTVTYKRLLSSDRVLAAAAGRLEVEGTLDAPRIRLVDQTGLVLIEMRGSSPEEAQARAAALTSAFLSELETLRHDEQTRRAESTRGALSLYEASVADIRREITALQRASGLSSPEQYDAIIAERDRLAARLRDLEAELEETTGRVAALGSALGVGAREAALSLRLQSDPEFRNLASAMAEAGADLATARGEYGERHPVLIAARERYAGAIARLTARAGLLSGVRGDRLAGRIDLGAHGERAVLLAELVRLSAERAGLSTKRATVADALARAETRIDALLDAAARLDDLKRDYKVAEAVFTSALARVDTSKADVFASYPLVQVLEPASLPTSPSSPRRIVAIAAGIGGTLCLFVALALAWLRRPVIAWLIGRVTGT